MHVQNHASVKIVIIHWVRNLKRTNVREKEKSMTGKHTSTNPVPSVQMRRMKS